MINYTGLVFIIVTNVTMFFARCNIRRDIQPLGHRVVFFAGLAALGVFVINPTSSMFLEMTLSYLAVIVHVALRIVRAKWDYDKEVK